MTNPNLISGIDDIHEKIGIESGGVSIVSYPFNSISVPEVKDVRSSFVYNYFTKDERVRSSNGESKDKILDLDLDFTNEIFFQISNERIPRYVKLEFKQPNSYGVLKNVDISTLIQDNIDKILIEGAI